MNTDSIIAYLYQSPVVILLQRELDKYKTLSEEQSIMLRVLTKENKRLSSKYKKLKKSSWQEEYEDDRQYEHPIQIKQENASIKVVHVDATALEPDSVVYVESSAVETNTDENVVIDILSDVSDEEEEVVVEAEEDEEVEEAEEEEEVEEAEEEEEVEEE